MEENKDKVSKVEKVKNKGESNWFTRNVNKLVIALVILVAGVAIISTSNNISGESLENNIFRGIVAAKDVSINTKIPGRVAEIKIEEGQSVKSGDVILKIKSDELQAKEKQLIALVEQAEAGVEAARSQRDMAKAASE